MRRFYTDQPLQLHSHVTLCDKSYHHWVRVLRAKTGDQAVLFNGNGGEYHATLTSISKKSAQATLTAFSPENRNNPYDVTIALVMSKGDRMDYALQKSTELGVRHIQLLTSENCEVKLSDERLEKKLRNWQGVILSACEQSGLNLPPTLLPPIPLATFTKEANHTHKLVVAPTDSGDPNLPFDHEKFENMCCVIGPEGGLSSSEITQAQTHGFSNWCLGKRILRTETAPVVVMSMIQLYWFQARF